MVKQITPSFTEWVVFFSRMNCASVNGISAADNADRPVNNSSSKLHFIFLSPLFLFLNRPADRITGCTSVRRTS